MSPYYTCSPAVVCAELASRRAAISVHVELRRRLVSLAMISSSAPLLGFLMTMFGMANSFGAVGTSRSTAIAALTAKLAAALVPVVVSLFVAIPAYCAYQTFSSDLDLFDAELQNAAAELADRLMFHFPKPHHLVQPLHFAEGAGQPSTARLRFLLPRIWPHGMAELVWPRLETAADADVTLQLTSTLCRFFALLIGLNYYSNHRPWAGLIALAFFALSGAGLRTGSWFAAASLLVYSAMALAASIVTANFSLRTISCMVIPLWLLGWWKARRVKGQSGKARWLNACSAAVFALALVAGLFDNILALHQMDADSSMEPTLHSGEPYLTVATPITSKLRRGDLVYVVANEVRGPCRIVGFPGDRIRVASGHVFRNGKLVEEPFPTAALTIAYGDFPIASEKLPENIRGVRETVFRADVRAQASYLVPENKYFVLNDNRGDVHDSRIFGPEFERTLRQRPILAFSCKGFWPKLRGLR